MEVKTYKVKHHLGDCPGDMATEWWTKEDWDKHSKYVEELKQSGEYGKEVEYELSFIPCPLFDEPSPIINTVIESSRLIFLDTTI